MSVARSRARIALLVLGLVAAVATGGLAFAYPAAAAAICPACYGFEPIAPALYIEAAAGLDEREVARRTIEEAKRKVEGFYGAVPAMPRTLICTTPDCYRRVGGGGSRGMALYDLALLLAPNGANTVIAAHELAHAALHARIGRAAVWSRRIPQWFDEGLAVVISGDERYLRTSGDRCLVEPDGPLPTERGAWIEGAQSRDFYAKAACRVSRWIEAKGGDAAARATIESWASGAPFDVANE